MIQNDGQSINIRPFAEENKDKEEKRWHSLRDS